MQKIKIPYLHDHHSHFSLYAGLNNCLNIKEESSKEKVLDMIREISKNELNAVYGWNSGKYRFSQSELESLPPVVILNLSLHGFIMNSSAEKLLKDKYPEIIGNYKDPSWCEEHLTELVLFFSQILPFSVNTALEFADILEKRYGIHEIEDMLLPSEEVFEIIENSSLFKRVSFWADINTFRTLSNKTASKIKGVKLFADGANGAATAAIGESYITGEKGFLTHSDFALTELMDEALSTSKGVAVHAIGDRAIDQIISVVKDLRKKGLTDTVRIEHCQFIFKESAKKAKDLGIVLSMQPNFNEDSLIYADRIPKKYVIQNNPFRMLIDEVGFIPGIDLIFGSDGMPHGIEFALEQVLWPTVESQKLSIEELIDGYCLKDGERNLEIEIDHNSKKVKILN